MIFGWQCPYCDRGQCEVKGANGRSTYLIDCPAYIVGRGHRQQRNRETLTYEYADNISRYSFPSGSHTLQRRKANQQSDWLPNGEYHSLCALCGVKYNWQWVITNSQNNATSAIAYDYKCKEKEGHDLYYLPRPPSSAFFHPLSTPP